MLVTIASFTEPWEAHMFRLRLEAEGVFAVVAHEHHVAAQWPYALALGGAKVQVCSGEWHAAREVERQCRAGTYHATLETVLGPLDQRRCPRCASTRLRSRRALQWLLLLLVSYLYTGVIFPVAESMHRCEDCGESWSESRPRNLL